MLAILAVLTASAAVASAAAPKPLPIAVGHSNPVVEPTLDPSRTVTKLIGSDGGTLTTIADDGASITLTVPRNALTGDEQVSVTPLVSLDGGGVTLLDGVQIAPDGLRVLEPATLTIAPAKSVPTSQQVAFGYTGTGSQFGLVPLATGSTISIPLIKFGGAGLARANSGQLNARISHPPSDIEGGLLSQLAAPSYQIRSHHSAKSAQQVVLGTLSGYYDSFVKTTLGSPGSSITAWARAATRSAGWENEVQVLGYARKFRKQEKVIKGKVFEKSLHKRWSVVTRSCLGGGANLGNLQKALQLSRIAQIRRTGALLGGTTVIDADIASCAQMTTASATLGATSSNWQSGQAADVLSQVAAVVNTGPAPLVLQGRGGTNGFVFLSAHVPIFERMTSWTLSPMYASCSKPAFVGFTTDPTQLFAAFYATLTVPPDLFVGAKAPAARITLSVFGADMATWSTTCPNAVSFAQSAGAMAGLGAVTGTSPIQLNPGKTTVKFQGSANILSGTTIAAFGNEIGSASVKFPS